MKTDTEIEDQDQAQESIEQEVPFAIEEKIITVTYLVTGRKPLLCASLANADLSGKQKAKSSTERPTDPEKIAESLAYPYNGAWGFPAVAFRTALISGGKFFKIGKYAAPSMLCAAVMHVGDFVQIIDPKTRKPIKKFTVDSRPAFNKQRGAILVHRPRFDEWACMVSFEVDENLIPELPVLDKFLNIAGVRYGIGAFRIEKKGWFGKFRAERISPV